MRLATTKPAVKKGVRLAMKVPAVPVVRVKKGTAQASCCHGLSPPPLACYILDSVLVIGPLTPPSNTPQEQGFEPVVAKKAVNKTIEQARRRRARDPLTTAPAPPTSSILSSRSHQCISLHLRHAARQTPDLRPVRLLECRTTKSLLITRSGAPSKSPRPSSIRTTMLRCGRRAGHALLY